MHRTSLRVARRRSQPKGLRFKSKLVAIRKNLGRVVIHALKDAITAAYSAKPADHMGR